MLALSLAACSDALRVREAPVDTRMAVIMILEPLRGTQPMEIQETPGLPHTAVEVVVESGDSLVVADTMVPGTTLMSLVPCADRHGMHIEQPRPDSASWIWLCTTFEFEPRYGTAYTVRVSREGRRTATASTLVPGDFEIVDGEIEGEPPRRISATWTRSAGAYRYLVALGGGETMGGDSRFECLEPSCARWFAVTQDTTLASAIDPRYLERTSPPYSIKVWAVSKELFEGVMTGATSGFFPIPPAQNVSGGLGTVGAWVRRSLVWLADVEFQAVTDGIRVTNRSDIDVRFAISAQGDLGKCTIDMTACRTLTAGESTIVARAEIPELSTNERSPILVVCPADGAPVECRSLQIRL